LISLPMKSLPTRRIKLGVVANEFFDQRVGRMGGFGWAARQVARCFRENPARGVDVVFLTNARELENAERARFVHETPLVCFGRRRFENVRRLRAEKIDLLLLIDYRPNYRFFARALPRTPVIVWVRDPRTPADIAKVCAVRIPGVESVEPQGIEPIDCTSLAGVARESRMLSRHLLLATPAPHLAAKVEETYGVGAREVFFLPNIVELDAGEVLKSPHPRVIFLGRLDAVKRPWLFVKLAELFPHVEFLVLGQSHFQAEGAWKPESLPSNVRLLGHLDGAEKTRLLASAWVLVNTSIHEGLPVSFLEALACETPILSCQDPGGVVSRFGVYTGNFDGSGLEALPKFADGLERLLRDGKTCARLGREGCQWVAETHSAARFLTAFDDLCARAGVRMWNGAAATTRA
jgi:glycosyltransferase involved in cell wall biosynthesis